MATNKGSKATGPELEVCGPQSLVAAGLGLLLRAHDYASHSSAELWQFALESEELRRAGLTNSEFRWMLTKGYVRQAQEVTLSGDKTRSFRRLGKSILLPESCFVLTATGVRVARKIESSQIRQTLSAGPNGASPVPLQATSAQTGLHLVKPTWDPIRRELWVAGVVVKTFKWRACNQEVILLGFEEEGWPSRIDDPLPATVDEHRLKRRLHDTIKCLNRHQQSPLVHFRGDGTGLGVIWEFPTEAPNRRLSRNGDIKHHPSVGSTESA